MVDQKKEMPYNVTVDIAFKLIDELSGVGEDGVGIDRLFVDIGESSVLGKSFLTTFLEFLGLAKIDNKKIYSTKLCRSLAFQKTKRNHILAENLPVEYNMMLKWIKHSNSQAMSSGDIKAKYTNDVGHAKSNITLDRAVTTFLTYTKALGLISRAGKGRGTNYELTDFGKKILSGSKEEILPEKKNLEPDKLEDIEEDQKGYHVGVSASDRYPIKINIHTEADWDAIESLIKAYRESWKKNFSESGQKKN